MSINKLYINNQLPTLNDIENHMCLVGDLIPGVYQIKDHKVIEICDEDEDYEIIVIV